jgi:hypothetical protein
VNQVSLSCLGIQEHTLRRSNTCPRNCATGLIEVVDPDIERRLLGTDSGDKSSRLLAQFIPLHVEDLASFQSAHRKFILISGRSVGSMDWFTEYLVQMKSHDAIFEAGRRFTLHRRAINVEGCRDYARNYPFADGDCVNRH